MKETLAYIRAITEKKQESALLVEMQKKFAKKPLNEILDTLLQEGMIYEPRPGLYKYLG